MTKLFESIQRTRAVLGPDHPEFEQTVAVMQEVVARFSAEMIDKLSIERHTQRQPEQSRMDTIFDELLVDTQERNG